MISVLVLGLLIGIRHAFEADHIAAVASLATRSHTRGETVRLGIAWGLGHTATLFFVGTIVLMAGSQMPERIAAALEFAVGLMLIVLGGDVLRRIFRDRIHVHAHRHGDAVHWHFHSHAEETDHAASAHRHEHRAALPVRALLVGMIHGMAGSAALVLLTLGTIQTVWLGMIYMALFGLGSIAGMSVLSFAISFPLRFTMRRLTGIYTGLTGAIGMTTVLLGGMIAYRIGVKEGLLGLF